MTNEWQRQYDQSVSAEAERQLAALSQASKPRRALAAVFGTLHMIGRMFLMVMYPALAVHAFGRGSVTSVLLGVALLMLFSFSMLHTLDRLKRRRAARVHWLTGLPRRAGVR